MTHFNNISMSPLEAEILETSDYTNDTQTPIYVSDWNFVTHCSIFIFASVICIFGLVGNGFVIWLLGFRIQRNSFTIYILNLAIADFGVLVSIILFCLQFLDVPTPVSLDHTAECLFPFTFCTSQFLLTVISIDICVCVFFPIWHRCRRPPHLSIIVCSVIWLLNFLLCGIQIIFKALNFYDQYILLYQFFVNVLLCFPLITISTLTLLLKVYCKPKQHKRGKLLTIILLTLFFFLIVAFPFNAVILFSYFSSYVPTYLYHYGYLCASLNSAVNPVIYILVGRKKRGQVRENIKAILQRVFKEEDESLDSSVHCQSNTETVM